MASFRVFTKGMFSIDVGAGPYYFDGAYQEFAAGGKAYIKANLTDYVTLSFSGSYDNLFHQRGQGILGITIPFGPRGFGEKCSKAPPCKQSSFFDSSLAKGAERNEIIVLDRHEKTLAAATAGGTEVAINPFTGEPYITWFVDNTSHSDGTFESPFPTVQEAMAVAQTGDIIYIYEGDGSPYDVAVTLLDGQLFLGSGVAQTVPTTFGPVTIPAQSAGSPNLENTMGATMITLANQNTVSGFNLNVLSAGNTIVATSIDSLSFLNNVFSTAVTTGMNNLTLTDCTGTLLVQNNQFTMAAGDTGSNGIFLTDAGSGTSSLSVLTNEFTNHASRALSLNYSGSSSPTLNIGSSNIFTPPTGAGGTNAIDIVTSNATVLSGSISSQNQFTGYTANVIHLNWAGSGTHDLTIANNSLSSDSAVTGTTGVDFTTNASGHSSLTISGNQLTNQTNNGISCTTGTNANLSLTISNNTIAATPEPGGSGIRVTANDTSTITGSITSNTCSEHLAANINGFPSGSSSTTLTIAHNTLQGPTTVPGGSFPNGIQFNASNSTSMNLNINHNQLTNHSSQGINLFASDTATAMATIDSNTLTVPDSLVGTAGIQVSANNSAATTSTFIVTNNICTGHTNANIQSFPNNSAIIHLTISGNTLSGPTVTPGGSFPQGIQISAGNSSSMTALINGQNHCSNHTDHGINLFAFDDALLSAIIDNNTVIAPVSATSTSGISIGSNNSSAVTHSYTITNNTCTGQNNGCIQCFPSGSTQFTLEISGNQLASVTNGIAGQTPTGIQVSANNSTNLINTIITGNTWTSPSTYETGTNPQGLNIGASNTATAANITISNNTLNLPFTSYQDGTGPSGIQFYLNNNATMNGLTISHNTVTYPNSTYLNNTGPNGMSVNANNASILTGVNISNNSISFAPLLSALTTFQTSGLSVGGGDTSMVGTALSPVLIQQNTITGIEGNGITLLSGSSNDIYMTALNNTISLGTVMQGEIGIVTVPFGAKLVSVIDGNTIEGNHGGFVGIVATNQGATCQDVTIQNNTVTNILGTNPSIPIPGIGGGLGAAILGTGNLNVTFNNNALSGNTPQGIFALDSAAFGGSGNMCVTLQNNHGVGAQAPDNYTLLNPTMAAPSTFTYDYLTGNTGTLNFVPSMGDFHAGTCTTCP